MLLGESTEEEEVYISIHNNENAILEASQRSRNVNAVVSIISTLAPNFMINVTAYRLWFIWDF